MCSSVVTRVSIHSATAWDTHANASLGQVAEAKPDQWYGIGQKSDAHRIYLKAAQLLVDEKKAEERRFPFAGDGFRAPVAELVGGQCSTAKN